jgi:hypothetical protein
VEGGPSFSISLSLASFGLSFVLEKPIRREFLSLYIDGLDFRVENKGILRSFELCIDDVQVDNYSETVIYPVLLHSSKKEEREKLKNRENDRKSSGSPRSSIRSQVCYHHY